MAYLTDIEIAQQCEMRPITEIAKCAHVDEKYIEQYGKFKAKIDLSLLKETNKRGCHHGPYRRLPYVIDPLRASVRPALFFVSDFLSLSPFFSACKR